MKINDPMKQMQQQNGTGGQQQSANNNGVFTQPKTSYSSPNAGMKPVNKTENGYGVREFMVANGMDNAKIGWNADTGIVTYDGKDFYKPDSVIDGTSYAGNLNQLYSQVGNTLGRNNVPLRDTFENMGINVNWDDKTKQITAGGKKIDPAYITEDGISYGDKKTFQEAARDIYKENGNPLVVATDYAASVTGIGDLVQFRDGQISVGGIMLKPTYISEDGKAYIPTKEIDAAIAQYKKKTGLMSGNEVYDEWFDKYGKMADNQLDKILNREEWSYDPYNDPAYLAYRDQYQREGNRAFQDAIGSMSAATGGYMSSAAMTAGGQAQNYYMQQMNDRIPELQQNDYNRYLNEQNLRQQALKSIMEVGDGNYNKRYQTNRDTVNDLNYANERNYNRDKESRAEAREQDKWNVEKRGKESDLYRREIENADYQEYHDLDMNNAREDYRNKKYTNSYENAKIRGHFTADEARIMGIELNPDGTLPSPNQGEWIRALELYNNADKLIEQSRRDGDAETEKALIKFKAEMEMKIDKENADNQIRIYNSTKK